MYSGNTKLLQRQEILDCHTKHIAQFLNRRMGKHVEAIILSGSFGHDEGTMEFDMQGKMGPENDYDIIIILNSCMEKYNRALLSKWEDECAEEIGIKWIDFAVLCFTELEKMSISQANFDIKWGSRIIWGNKNIFERIPNYESKDIPISEAQLLLTTRCWCFLGITPYAILDGEKEIEKDQTLYKQQLCKALVAAGDSYLIINKKYSVKYSEKYLLYKHLTNKPIVDNRLIEWAYTYKLGLQKELPESYTIKRLLLESLKIHIRTWKEVRRFSKLSDDRYVCQIKSAIVILVKNVSVLGFKRMFLDIMQIRFLVWLNKNSDLRIIRFSDSIFLWLYSRSWIRKAPDYVSELARLRLYR